MKAWELTKEDKFRIEGDDTVYTYVKTDGMYCLITCPDAICYFVAAFTPVTKDTNE